MQEQHIERKLSDLCFRVFLLARKPLYLILAKIGRPFLGHTKIIILCYHSISDDGWVFSVPLADLKKQISYLMDNYSPITIGDLEKHVSGRKQISKPSFLITFDDGYKNILSAKDFFMEKRLHPVLFMVSDPENADRDVLRTNLPLLNKAELLALIKAGWVVGCHTGTHPDFSITKGSCHQEIFVSKLTLEKQIGQKVDYFAYPKGRRTTEHVKMLRRAEFKLGFTMDDQLITDHTDPLQIPRSGINGTYSLAEFEATFSPGVVFARHFIKRTVIGKLADELF